MLFQLLEVGGGGGCSSLRPFYQPRPHPPANYCTVPNYTEENLDVIPACILTLNPSPFDFQFRLIQKLFHRTKILVTEHFKVIAILLS